MFLLKSKWILKLLCVSCMVLQLFFSTWNQSFANTGSYISEFKISNASLQTFLKPELTEIERDTVEKLLASYINAIESHILSSQNNWKKEVFALKQALYTDILPYINIQNLWEFKSLVEGEAKNYNLTGNIWYVWNNPSVIGENKLIELKNQAEKNTALIREQLQSKILKEVEKRIEIIVTQEKFQSLPNSAKRELFEKFSTKLSSQIQTLQSTPSPTGVIDEKILLYHGILELLQSYIDAWSQ